MIDNPRSPRVRAVAKLAKREARSETGLFLVEGPQALSEALAFRPELVVDIFTTRAAWEKRTALAAAAAQAGVTPEFVTDAVLDAMADTVTPQGVVAVCEQPRASLEAVLESGPRLMAVLEEVRDPGNAGTIIRAADSAGADAVVLSGRSVDAFNPKVVRATTGSIFHLPVVRADDLTDVLAQVKSAGLQVIAADIRGGDLLAARTAGALAAPTAWLFGNEAHGLSEEHHGLADWVIQVPIYGHAESMNLATAASVCLYESAFAQRS